MDWKEKAIKILRDSLYPIPSELNELDWKSGLSDKSERIAQHISAFANMKGGGILVYGVNNDGTCFSITKDEIDKIVGEMSDSEIEFVNSNTDFAKSNQTVMAILQREQLRMMRPLVENTKDGKEALENHLALVKRLKKEAANESDKAMNMFKEYTEKYSDMPYSEFLKMKRKKEK